LCKHSLENPGHRTLSSLNFYLLEKCAGTIAIKVTVNLIRFCNIDKLTVTLIEPISLPSFHRKQVYCPYPDEFDSAGIAYRCIPLASNAPPRPGDLELCLKRLEMCYAYARSEIEAGRTLLVHCRHGKDRTGMFMAHYLKMQRSLSTLEAIAQVKAVRPVALTADGWDQLAIEVLDACEAAV